MNSKQVAMQTAGVPQEMQLVSRIREFYDDYHRLRERRPSDWMRRHYWPALRGRTLEIGGGTLLPQRPDYVLADLSTEAARRAFQFGLPALVADGTRMPFADNAFDTVTCFDVLEHVVNVPLFLSEMCRVARQRVVIAGPNYIAQHPGGISRYLPLRLWSFLFGKGRGCATFDDPHLSFDEHWYPDRDAISAPNAGWVAEQLKRHGLVIQQLRSWEYNHHWLNHMVAIRCLGPFMFVVGAKP